jgi:hypothetical protein
LLVPTIDEGLNGAMGDAKESGYLAMRGSIAVAEAHSDVLAISKRPIRDNHSPSQSLRVQVAMSSKACISVAFHGWLLFPAMSWTTAWHTAHKDTHLRSSMTSTIHHLSARRDSSEGEYFFSCGSR